MLLRHRLDRWGLWNEGARLVLSCESGEVLGYRRGHKVTSRYRLNHGLGVTTRDVVENALLTAAGVNCSPESVLIGSPLRGHFTNSADRDSVATLLGQYVKHLQWFEQSKLTALRKCTSFDECRLKGLHLEINMNGAHMYTSPAEFAEKGMPRRFLELLQPDGRTAASSCSLDGIGSSNTQRLPHGTLPV
eukprot:COSAG05_NODE_550_length_8736_cov_153.546254_1_plen_190_part_00